MHCDKRHPIKFLENPGLPTLHFKSNFTGTNDCTTKGFSIDQGLHVKEKEFTRSLISDTVVYNHGIEKDDIFQEKYKIRLEFYLKTGCYATMLIKQLIQQAEEN